MSKKDIDFTNVSLPADEFDAMMRRALDATPAAQDVAKPKTKNESGNRKAKKSSQ